MDDDSNERTFRRETALNPFDVTPEWTYLDASGIPSAPLQAALEHTD